MSLRAGEWALIGIAAISAGVAVWGRANLEVSAIATSLAIIVTATIGVVGLWERTSSSRPAPALSPRAPLPALVDAFSTGELGRDRILAVIEQFERETAGVPEPRRNPQARRRVRRLSSSAFEQWVSQRLDELEKET